MAWGYLGNTRYGKAELLPPPILTSSAVLTTAPSPTTFTTSLLSCSLSPARNSFITSLHMTNTMAAVEALSAPPLRGRKKPLW